MARYVIIHVHVLHKLLQVSINCTSTCTINFHSLHEPADNTREVSQVERYAVGALVVDVIVVDVGVAVEQHRRVLGVAGVVDDDSSRFLSTASSDYGDACESS